MDAMETRGLPKGGAEHGGDGASPTSCLPPAAVSSTGRPMQMLAAFMLFRDSCARALRNILGTLSSSETFRRSTSPLCTRDTRRTPRAPRQVRPQAPPRQHGERTDGARTRGTEGRVSSQALVPFTERTSRLPQRKAVGADAASGRQIPASGPLPPPRSALRAPRSGPRTCLHRLCDAQQRRPALGPAGQRGAPARGRPSPAPSPGGHAARRPPRSASGGKGRLRPRGGRFPLHHGGAGAVAGAARGARPGPGGGGLGRAAASAGQVRRGERRAGRAAPASPPGAGRLRALAAGQVAGTGSAPLGGRGRWVRAAGRRAAPRCL